MSAGYVLNVKIKFQLNGMNFMNTNDKGETNDQAIVIEDLSVPKAEAIQGGERQATLNMFTAVYCGTGGA
jgi:hypothetical protein